LQAARALLILLRQAAAAGRVQLVILDRHLELVILVEQDHPLIQLMQV
jgi:hypothetical protein